MGYKYPEIPGVLRIARGYILTKAMHYRRPYGAWANERHPKLGYTPLGPSFTHKTLSDAGGGWHNGHRAPTQYPSTNNRRLCVGAGVKNVGVISHGKAQCAARNTSRGHQQQQTSLTPQRALFFVANSQESATPRKKLLAELAQCIPFKNYVTADAHEWARHARRAVAGYSPMGTGPSSQYLDLGILFKPPSPDSNAAQLVLIYWDTFQGPSPDSNETFRVLNHTRRRTLQRLTAAPTATQLRVRVTLHILRRQAPMAGGTGSCCCPAPCPLCRITRPCAVSSATCRSSSTARPDRPVSARSGYKRVLEY